MVYAGTVIVIKLIGVKINYVQRSLFLIFRLPAIGLDQTSAKLMPSVPHTFLVRSEPSVSMRKPGKEKPTQKTKIQIVQKNKKVLTTINI